MIAAFLSGTPMQWAILLAVVTGFFGLFTMIAKTRPENKRAANEGDASLRTSLMSRISKLEETQVIDRDRHSEERRMDRKACDEVTDDLRQQLREQERLIDGLQRQLIMFQVASARALPLGENSSPELAAMLASLDAIKLARHEPNSPTLQAAEDAHAATGVTVEQVHQDEARK